MIEDFPEVTERQQGVAGFLFIFMAVLLPLAALVVAAFAAVWVKMLGGHPHRVIFGYISHTETADDGSTVWTVGMQPIYYWFALLNVWLLYQLGELTWFGFKSLRRAMT